MPRPSSETKADGGGVAFTTTHWSVVLTAQGEPPAADEALKFYASVRVDIRRIGAIKQTDGVVTGNRTRVKVVKNKVAPPFTEAEFDIMYNEGSSSTGALLDLALGKQIIEKRGSWLNYRGTQLAQDGTPPRRRSKAIQRFTKRLKQPLKPSSTKTRGNRVRAGAKL